MPPAARRIGTARERAVVNGAGHQVHGRAKVLRRADGFRASGRRSRRGLRGDRAPVSPLTAAGSSMLEREASAERLRSNGGHVRTAYPQAGGSDSGMEGTSRGKSRRSPFPANVRLADRTDGAIDRRVQVRLWELYAPPGKNQDACPVSARDLRAGHSESRRPEAAVRRERRLRDAKQVCDNM
jgi:hypothetical protein